MKTVRKLAICFFLVVFCTVTAAREIPTVNIPENLRETNFEGNCVHASFVNLLRWQGRYDWADWWIQNHGGGETATSFKSKVDTSGALYAMTAGQNDVRFLEKSVQTRRGCAVAVYNGELYGYSGRIAHVVCLVHMDDKIVGLIDNNFNNRLIYVDREAFLADWSRTSWAFTPLMGAPAPPQLWRHHENAVQNCPCRVRDYGNRRRRTR